MGPLIKTIMTRCIHCTRCVRFSEEVAGVDEIGALYRGEDMQITTYLEHAAKHELSANVIDLCPVGALTSAPYAYEARPWELKKTLGIDVSDAMGSNIRIDSRGREVLRVLPRINDDVNEEWISDKARYQVEGLTKRRLDRVYIRRKGKLEAASWDEAFKAIAKAHKSSGPGKSIAAIAGDMLDCETMFAAKALLKACGSNLVESRQTAPVSSTSTSSAAASSSKPRTRSGRATPSRARRPATCTTTSPGTIRITRRRSASGGSRPAGTTPATTSSTSPRPDRARRRYSWPSSGIRSCSRTATVTCPNRATRFRIFWTRRAGA
jgi:NADH dehydrogenase/NADH:ubiquinone oxidoreductase subunit G